MSYISKAEFIEELGKAAGITGNEAVQDAALSRGWIEKQDIREADKDISRFEAARIAHMFLLKEKHTEDLADISGAEILRDLYDCRVCVNHVAQVFLRGLIGPRDLPGVTMGSFLIFDGRDRLRKEEAKLLFENLGKIGC